MAGLMYPGGSGKPKLNSLLGFYEYDSASSMPTISLTANTKYMSSGIKFSKACKVKVTAYVSKEVYRISVTVTVAGQTLVSYTNSTHPTYTSHTKTFTVNPGDTINVVVSNSSAWPQIIVTTEFVE